MNARNRKELARIISPPPRLKISEWSDQFAYIPPEGNAEPGKFRLSRMPHQEAMLDDPIDPKVREVFWMLASQAGGKTACLNLITEYAICQARKSIIMVRATQKTAAEWFRDKFLTSTRATPAMAGLLKDPRKRDSESTMMNRKFPGGFMRAIGASSPADFRGSSAPVILQDEVDSYEVSAEGDPCALADRAAITFSDSWKIKCSTPTIAGFSRIHEGYLRGDQQKYFLPCHCCGGFQPLEFEQLKFSFSAEEKARFTLPDFHPGNFQWTTGTQPHYDTARTIYVCKLCSRGWTDQDRLSAYMSGHKDNPPVVVDGKELRAHWQGTADFKGIRSRHLSGMYLSIGLKRGFENYLHQFAEDFLQAKKGGRETLMSWTNMFQSMPFEDAHDKLDWETLQARAEDYDARIELPVEVMFIVAGCDVQINPARVEIQVLGIGDNDEAWVLEHEVIAGDFDMPDMQELVFAFLNKRYKHPILGELPITVKLIDSGKQTKVKAVFQFCKKHLNQRCYAIKGFGSMLGAVFTEAKERAFGIPRYNLNVDYLKNTVADKLKNADPGPNHIHFPKHLKARYFSGLCSERKVPERVKNGGWVSKWKKVTASTANEVWDTMVYCWAAVFIVKPTSWISAEWRRVEKILAERNKVEPEKKDYVLKTEHDPQSNKIPELRQLEQAKKSHTAPRRRGSFVGVSGKWL